MIVLRDVSLIVEGRTIVDHASLSVGPAETVGLVGPNGSGKTSLFRCILGLAPFAGTITLNGRDVVQDAVRARQAIGYLPQRPAFGDVTAAEALTFIADLRGLSRVLVPPVLERTGLAEHAGRNVRCFSGGMLQRLSLASALLVKPRILLLDEPTASLDGDGQALFASLVAEWRHASCVLMMTSHRAEEIARFTDRVVPMWEGRFTPPDLRRHQGVVLKLKEVRDR